MILQNDFFDKDCLRLAPDLVGKILVRRLENGEELRVRITETEATEGLRTRPAMPQREERRGRSCFIVKAE